MYTFIREITTGWHAKTKADAWKVCKYRLANSLQKCGPPKEIIAKII
jgi:hypothetical protein